MLDEIGVYDGVEEMVVHRIVNMRVLVVVTPVMDSEQCWFVRLGKTNHRVR